MKFTTACVWVAFVVAGATLTGCGGSDSGSAASQKQWTVNQIFTTLKLRSHPATNGSFEPTSKCGIDGFATNAAQVKRLIAAHADYAANPDQTAAVIFNPTSAPNCKAKLTALMAKLK